MRISANLGFLYTELPMVARIEAAARAGFDAVEFHWPYETPAADLGAALRAAGLPGLALNTLRGDVGAGEFGLAALPGRRREARRAIDQAIDYAAQAGIGAVHVLGGKAAGVEAEAAFLDNLAHASERAAQAGLMILIEPLNTRDVPGVFLSNNEAAWRLISAVGRDNIRILYDFYHAQVTRGDHLRTIADLGGLIGHFQIAGCPDRGEPEQGELNFHLLLDRVAPGDTFVGAEFVPSRDPALWLAEFRAAHAAYRIARGASA